MAASDQVLTYADVGGGSVSVYNPATGNTTNILASDIDKFLSGIGDITAALTYNASIRLGLQFGYTAITNPDGTIKADAIAALNSVSFKVP